MVMNDVFTNYYFAKEENWEDLHSIVNMFIAGYTLYYPETLLKPIKGEIAPRSTVNRHTPPKKP